MTGNTPRHPTEDVEKQVIMIAMQLDLVIDIRLYIVEELISLSICILAMVQ